MNCQLYLCQWGRTLCLFLFFACHTFRAGGQTHKVDFTADKWSGCVPLTVTFTNQSDPGYSKLNWSFGAGAGTDLPAPSRSFTAPGIYTVTLTVTYPDGAVLKKEKQVSVYKLPVPEFTTSVNGGCAPLKVVFTDKSAAGDGAITGITWDFGDGTGGSGSTATHTYTLGGIQTAAVIVTNSKGCTNGTERPVKVQSPPDIAFTSSLHESCQTPLTVSFVNNSTATPPAPLSFSWDFGDGGTGTDAHPQHTYSRQGVFTVTLTAATPEGCRQTFKATDYVKIMKMKPDFAVNGSACAQQPSQLMNTTHPAPLAARWTFPDGSVQHTVNASYTFPAPGDYAITMTAVADGCEESVTKTIQVHPMPAAGFTARPNPDCHVPSLTKFTAQTPGATAWQWDFGDGQTSTAQHPSHSYQSEGRYTVTLSASNAGGCRQTLTKPSFVRVQEPGLKFSISRPGGCIPFTARFTPFVTGEDPVVKYTWEFGDGGTSHEASPAYTYTKQGDYTATLQIETRSGCKLTYSQPVSAGEPVKVDFEVDHTAGCQPDKFKFRNTSVPPGTEWRWVFPNDGQSEESGPEPEHTFSNIGWHDVILTVYNHGCPSELKKTALVEIYPPAANFLATLMDCGNPYQYRFTDKSQFGTGDGARSWHWDFGDNTGSSDEQSPVYTYKEPGDYTVLLTVTYGNCRSYVSALVHVLDRKPAVQASSTSICAGKGITYSLAAPLRYELITHYYWSWGDGTTTEVLQKDFKPNTLYTHLYPAAGRYQVSLSVRDINGCMRASDPLDITVYSAIAGFRPSTVTPCKEQAVAFADQSSTMPGGKLVSWRWDYGDGSPAETYSVFKSTVSHTFRDASAPYNVTLTVTNDQGCAATMATAIRVDVVKAVITVPRREACLNKPFVFTSASVGNNLSYQWSFGDGSTSTLPTPTHTYTATGVYAVKLTVTNPNGCQDTRVAEDLVTVRNPAAAFSIPSSLPPCPPVVVAFSNHSSDYDQVAWEFGDGSTSAEVSPSHAYRRPGNYDVRLRVYTAGGCSSDPVQRVVPIEGPDGRQSVTPLTGCLPLPITMQAQSSRAVKFIWDFDDGQVVSTTGPAVSHTYRQGGVFYPRLILEDAKGCQVTALGDDRIVVDEVKAAFSIDVSQACDGGYVYFRDQSTSVTAGQLGLPMTFQWDFGIDGPDDTGTGATPRFHYNRPGTYPVKLTAVSAYGCKGDTILPTIVNPQPIAQILPIAPVCAGSPVELRGAEQKQIPGTLWNWKIPPDKEYTATEPPRITFDAPGSQQVQLTITNANGSCPHTASAFAQVNPLPDLSPSPLNANICQGQSLVLQSNVTPGTRVTWTPYNISDIHSPSPRVHPEKDTAYHVLAENGFGCTREDDLRITVTQPHKVSVSDAVICQGQRVQLHAGGAARYQWISGTGLDRTDVGDPMASPRITTTYYVVGFGENDCFRDTASVQVTVNPTPGINAGPDQVVPAGSEVRLQLQTSPDVTKVQWEPGTWLSCTDCPAPLAQPRSSISYHITATNQYNCISTDELNLKLVCESGVVFLPNTFSPNGDGQNDIFYIRGRGIRTVKVFRIFNRWGQLVFERGHFNAEDPAAGWDGSFRGVALNPDVFVYYTEMVCDTNETFVLKGNVTLLK